jgi:hypothetical protein
MDTGGRNFSTKQGDSEKSRRLDELRQGEPGRALRIDGRRKPAPRQKRSASQSPLRYTPPTSVNQKPKQRSRLDLLVSPFGDNHMLTIT